MWHVQKVTIRIGLGGEAQDSAWIQTSYSALERKRTAVNNLVPFRSVPTKGIGIRHALIAVSASSRHFTTLLATCDKPNFSQSVFSRRHVRRQRRPSRNLGNANSVHSPWTCGMQPLPKTKKVVDLAPLTTLCNISRHRHPLPLAYALFISASLRPSLGVLTVSESACVSGSSVGNAGLRFVVLWSCVPHSSGSAVVVSYRDAAFRLSFSPAGRVGFRDVASLSVDVYPTKRGGAVRPCSTVGPSAPVVRSGEGVTLVL